LQPCPGKKALIPRNKIVPLNIKGTIRVFKTIKNLKGKLASQALVIQITSIVGSDWQQSSKSE
jgi:hypothetical protein